MDNQAADGPADWSFARLLKDVPVPEKHRASLRKKQLDTVGNMMAVMLLANLLNVAVVLQSFRDSHVSSVLTIWGFSVIFISGLAVLRHMRMRKASLEGRVSDRHIDAIARGAMVVGLFWAAAPLFVMGSTSAEGQMVLSIVLAGMMFGGAFLLSRLPSAAFSYLVPVGIGLSASMAMEPGAVHHFIAVLTIVYLAVLIVAVRWTHLQFVEQHLSEAAVKEQTQLIGLLLRDFEESTSDWLWQTNTDGALEDIPLVIDTSSDTSSTRNHN